MNYQEKYINELNKILPQVDFKKLDQSCNSSNNKYAKEVLKQMHDAFVSVYRTDCLYDGEFGFVLLPAVIRAENTGYTALGVVSLDLEASGEHWGSIFLTPLGVLEDGGQELTSNQKEYINKTFIPYEYWYTPEVENDIHVDFENIPEQAADILNACYLGRLDLTEDNLTMGEMKP